MARRTSVPLEAFEGALELSASTARLHVRCVALASDKLRRGVLTPCEVQQAAHGTGATAGEVAELVAAGLWRPRPDGGHEIVALRPARDRTAAERKRRQRARERERASVSEDLVTAVDLLPVEPRDRDVTPFEDVTIGPLGHVLLRDPTSSTPRPPGLGRWFAPTLGPDGKPLFEWV